MAVFLISCLRHLQLWVHQPAFPRRVRTVAAYEDPLMTNYHTWEWAAGKRAKTFADIIPDFRKTPQSFPVAREL